MGIDTAKLKDRDYKGDDFDVPQDIQNGPRVDRKCTNLLCYIIFIVFNITLISFCIYGYINGSPGKLMAPLDANANFCGYSAGYENYPYGYIYNLYDASIYPTQYSDYIVCVEECPEEADDDVDCINTTLSTAAGGCDDMPESQKYGSYPVMGYCVPIKDTLPTNVVNTYSALYDQFLSTGVGSTFLDIYKCRWVILLGFLFSFVYSLVYIKMMDYAAHVCAWVSVALVQFSLIGIGIGAYYYRQDVLTNGYQSSYVSADDVAMWLNIVTWTMWTLAAIYYLCIACYFKALNISVGVLEAASDFVADTFRIIFVPIIFFFIGITVFIIWIAGLVCVGSVGDITAEAAGSQQKNVDWSESTSYMMWFMLFGLLWFVAFLMAANEFVIIVSSVTWYFSKKTDSGDGSASICTGFSWIFRYHGGSLAFGSFILALVWVIRGIFEYVAEKIQDAAGENCCTKCMIWTCRCCLDCFDRFLRYLNQNAYIYMALTGDPFCESALDVFCLMLKNAAKFGFVQGIGSIFTFLAKAAISSFTTITCYFLMKAMISPEDGVTSPIAPLLIIAFFGYLCGAIFVSVFEASANTILQCFLIDFDIARQTGHLEQSHIPDGLDKFLKKFGGDDIHSVEMTKAQQNTQNLLE